MKKIQPFLLGVFLLLASGALCKAAADSVVNVKWFAYMGFCFSANPGVGILGDGTGNSTIAQLMYSPDNVKDAVLPGGACAVNDVVWAQITITEDGIANDAEIYDSYAYFDFQDYTRAFTNGYVYARIFQDNDVQVGDWYFSTPLLALQEQTGNDWQYLTVNTDWFNLDAIDGEYGAQVPEADTQGPALTGLKWNEQDLPATVIAGTGTFSVAVSDPSDVSWVEFRINDELIGTSSGGGIQSASWDATSTSSNGIYELKIIAQDSLFNVSTQIVWVTAILALPPAPVIVAPVNNRVFIGVSNVTFYGTASGNVSQVIFRLNGFDVPDSSPIRSGGTFSKMLTLTEGTNLVSAASMNRTGTGEWSPVHVYRSVPSPEPPKWWAERGVIDTNGTPNDYAPVNQGQAKQIARQAYLEFKQKLTNDCFAISNMVAGFSTSNNYLPVNLGQLKCLAAPFYDQLNTPELNGARPAGMGVGPYPWTGSTNPPQEYALANIGQLKYLFSFSVDADADGMSDLWEVNAGTDPLVNDAGSDPDNDGLTNYEEFAAGTNPMKADTDEDGIPDRFEVQNHLNPFIKSDWDADGLWDVSEVLLGTDRFNSDTDGDGFLDGEEYKWGYTSPVYNEGLYFVDSDGDGLIGREECFYHCNPEDSDTDGDGFEDGREVRWGSNPTNLASFLVVVSGDILSDDLLPGDFILFVDSLASHQKLLLSENSFSVSNLPNSMEYSLVVCRDSNANGVCDLWEEQGSTNIVLSVSTNGIHIELTHPDNDGEQLPDWWEYTYCGGNVDPAGDSDFDGLSNADEYILGTNPLNPDSDHDGALDGVEWLANTTATNSASIPASIRGLVYNGGGQAGIVFVLATTDSNDWSLALSTQASPDGNYQIKGLDPAVSYYVRAFVDTNANHIKDSGESFADCALNTVLPSQDTGGIDILIQSSDILLDTDGDNEPDVLERMLGRDPFAPGTVSSNTGLNIFVPQKNN